MSGTGDAIGVQVVPESRDSSIFTEPLKPTEVQVILCVLLTAQVSPPLGAVTVIILILTAAKACSVGTPGVVPPAVLKFT